MPVIFVHGVPDTERVWRKVIARIERRDVVTVRLPGFDCPVPPGFEATKDAYAGWLVEQIASHPEPVDLVGHDWGALLVVRAASLRPERVRSWAAGGAPLDPDYVWHQAAQAWQTPEVGEAVMQRLTPEALAKALAAAGVSHDDAREAAAHLDETMKQCILRLYRSAVHAGREWLPELARIPRRGLVLWGEGDPYAGVDFGRRLAERTGARFAPFANCSHWWQLERPDTVAAELGALWRLAEPPPPPVDPAGSGPDDDRGGRRAL